MNTFIVKMIENEDNVRIDILNEKNAFHAEEYFKKRGYKTVRAYRDMGQLKDILENCKKEYKQVVLSPQVQFRGIA